MQLLVPAALALLSFNVAGPQQKPASRSMFNVAEPKPQVIATSSQTQTSRRVISSTHDALKGISSLHVLVEELDDEAKAEGLNTEVLTQRAELALRRNGIKVLTRDELFQAAGAPYLYNYVQVRGSISSLDVECKQNVRSVIDPSMLIMGATIWQTGSMGGVRRTMEAMDQYLDRFCNDFLKANPK